MIRSLLKFIKLGKRYKEKQNFKLYKTNYATTTKNAPQDQTTNQTENSILEVKNERHKPVMRTQKVKVKRIQNMPFAKSFFFGKFDPDMLEYPEMDTAEVNHLEDMCTPINRLFEKLHTEGVTGDVNKHLKHFNLFGLNVPLEYGGSGLSEMEMARIGEELYLEPSIATTLLTHQRIGVETILKYGNDEQKSKYLPQLTSGNICAFCLTEKSCGSDLSLMESTAILIGNNTYQLNGEKHWITNGSIADLYIVLAKSPTFGCENESHKKTSAFIVEKSFGGISIGPNEIFNSVGETNICSIAFCNTKIPEANVIGDIGDGFKIAINAMNSFRLGTASVCGLMKRFMKDISNHVIETNRFGKQIKDFGLIQNKITSTCSSIYALESILYFTAGMVDNYKNPDFAVEAAMIKLFTINTINSFLNDVTQLFGAKSYQMDSLQNLLNCSKLLSLVDGTIDICKLFISLQSLQYITSQDRERFLSRRNIFNEPKLIWEFFKALPFNSFSNMKLKYKLYNYVHPNLSLIMEKFERCMLQFSFIIERNLGFYSNTIVDQQFQLERMANIATNLFVVVASCSRASRSLCIGLKNADEEYRLVCLLSDKILEQVGQEMTFLRQEKSLYGDISAAHITDLVCKRKSYGIVHPLTRNW